MLLLHGANVSIDHRGLASASGPTKNGTFAFVRFVGQVLHNAVDHLPMTVQLKGRIRRDASRITHCTSPIEERLFHVDTWCKVAIKGVLQVLGPWREHGPSEDPGAR